MKIIGGLKVGQQICIGKDVVVTVCRIRKNSNPPKVLLGIAAPPSVKIDRVPK
jgi:sRNA-binding carbon storage regulator CsrA